MDSQPPRGEIRRERIGDKQWRWLRSNLGHAMNDDDDDDYDDNDDDNDDDDKLILKVI